jgi:hypothetical protein
LGWRESSGFQKRVSQRFQDGSTDNTQERQKRVHFGSILSHFGALSGQKWPKRGQKWGFTVTSQLTMSFCMIFILWWLRDFFVEKLIKITIGGWGSGRFWGDILPEFDLKKAASRGTFRG